MDRLGILLIGLAIFTQIGYNIYKVEFNPEPTRTKYKTVDGCRYIKFNKEDWKHSYSCDNKCHLN